jgi:hypothetical protein
MSALCARNTRSRDLFLANCHQSFEFKKQSQKEQTLESQVKKLRSIIGDLTIELKKNEYEL